MRREPPAFERIRKDLEAGRLWKARDRLQGLLRWDPAGQAVLDALGDVSYRMADLPAAGRYWFLTERDDVTVAAALEAMYERHGRQAIELIHVLPVRTAIGDFPPSVQLRLRDLQAHAKTEGYTWEPGERRKEAETVKQTLRERIVEGFELVLVFLLFVGVWVVGLLTVIINLIDLVRWIF